MGIARSEDQDASWRRWLALAAALYLLNLSLSFHNIWPTLWVEDRHTLSVEIALLVLALAVWAEYFRTPTVGVRITLTVILTLSTIARYAQETAPALYGRSVNLYWDARHLPKVAAMLVEVAPLWLVVAGSLGLILLVLLIFTLLRWALRQLWWGLDRATPRRIMGVSAVLLALLYFGGRASDELRIEGLFSVPVSKTYAAQAGFLLDALSRSGAGQDLPRSPSVVSDLGRVQGAHVVVIFLESYGAVGYDRPRITEMLAPARSDLGQAIAQTGRGVASAFVGSTTFGGNSWLAHASLLSGVQVTDNRTYKLLLTQDRDTLVHRFKGRGYRALAVMPGLRQAWPEGDFYGFDTIYGAQALDYLGPAFGWWRIPDQYALARVDELELEAGDGPPRFVFFPTISTHLPFRPTPPYQSDWGRILSPEPYDRARLNKLLATGAELSDLAPSYANAVTYAYTWLAGYLRLRPNLDLVLLVIGDHQPPASVSGRDAVWDVPVHLITARREILGALMAEGFRRGLVPERPALGAIQDLYAILLRAFDSTSTARLPSAGTGAENEPPLSGRASEETAPRGEPGPAG